MNPKQDKLVEVNGARIESQYLASLVEEAKNAIWYRFNLEEISDHVHCMICNVAIDPSYQGALFRSEVGWLCNSCLCQFNIGEE